MSNLKIISGGQTGVDQAALRAAKKLGIPTGGWAPMGWLTEDGPAPWLGAEYGLEECKTASYPARTRTNAAAGDFTVWYGPQGSRGFTATRSGAWKAKKVFLPVAAGDESFFASKIREGLQAGPLVVNMAGNRESSRPGIGAEAEAFFEEVLKCVLEGESR